MKMLKNIVKACRRFRAKWILQFSSRLSPEEYLRDFANKYRG